MRYACLRNDVAYCGRNDEMFAPMCPQAHIIAKGNIISVSDIICPIGQTSWKKALAFAIAFFWSE